MDDLVPLAETGSDQASAARLKPCPFKTDIEDGF
jgi:hypothetical protein